MMKRSTDNEIKLGAVVSYIGIFIGIATMLLYTPWMINKIGKSDYGIYTLAISLANIFIFDFGLSRAAHKNISKNVADEKHEENNKVVSLFYKFYFYIAILIAVVLMVVYLLIPTLYKNFTALELIKFKNIFILIAVYSVVSFIFIPQNGVLFSYQRFVFIKSMDLFHKVFSTLLIILSLLMGRGLYSIIIGTIISGLLIIIFKQLVINFKIKIKFNFKYKNKDLTQDIIKVSLWSAIISFGQRFIFTITPSILGSLTNSEQVAVFGVISSFEGNFYTIGAALNGLFLTKNTKDIKENNIKTIEKDYNNLTTFVLLFMGLIITGFVLVGKPFINMWVGSDFNEAYLGIILILIPTYLYLPNQIPNNILLINDKLKYQGIVYIIMGVINIVMTFILIPHFGVIGAAISIFSSYMFRNIVMYVIYFKNLTINWAKYFSRVLTVLLIPLCLSLIGLPIIDQFSIDSLIKLLISIILITTVYMFLVGLFLLVIKKNKLKGITLSIE